MKTSPFLRAYMVCALWSSIDEQPDGNGGPPLDDKYGVEDIAPETVQEMRDDCAKFLFKARRMLASVADSYSMESAGHDFWLTRNGHGAGFWDRNELEADDLGDKLTDIAHAAGSRDLYVIAGLVYQD